MMTDAEFECWTNAPIVHEMGGDVLIVGFGLGLVIRALRDRKAITSITVLEIEPDVIALVGPYYPKAKIVRGDALTWKPPKRAFDYVYFDIWNNVPNADDWETIKALKRRYRSALKPKGVCRAWCENFAKREAVRT